MMIADKRCDLLVICSWWCRDSVRAQIAWTIAVLLFPNLPDVPNVDSSKVIDSCRDKFRSKGSERRFTHGSRG